MSLIPTPWAAPAPPLLPVRGRTERAPVNRLFNGHVAGVGEIVLHVGAAE